MIAYFARSAKTAAVNFRKASDGSKDRPFVS
jgi:hypothetical protein